MTQDELLELVDSIRREAAQKLVPETKTERAQFMTPLSVARLMASMLTNTGNRISILDAGAGVGSLFTAAVAKLASRDFQPEQIEVEAYEIDHVFAPFLDRTVGLCRDFCEERGIRFGAQLHCTDFIREFEEKLFFLPTSPCFDVAILNPPYGKIRSGSVLRGALSRLGIETANIYSGFIAVAMQLVKPDGELVAITPRSFCNGPYFKSFRKAFLRNMSLHRIHVFQQRNVAFKDDAVLQENVIIHSIRSASSPARVLITSSGRPNDPTSEFLAPKALVVQPSDPDSFIHLPLADDGNTLDNFRQLPCSLADLGLAVSTGRVVDFRAKELLRFEPTGTGDVPLIYPSHFSASGIVWPRQGKKPNAIALSNRAHELLIPNETYVLVKRFSAKEEARRIVACVYEGNKFPYALVGFENHLNYFHENGRGLSLLLASGLAFFLNSTLVDEYFRLFSGHTQVNATDLRKLKYPTREQLELLASRVCSMPELQMNDQLLGEMLSLPAERATT
jgi:adenine-specific DNA-methyltransferase